MTMTAFRYFASGFEKWEEEKLKRRVQDREKEIPTLSPQSSSVRPKLIK